MISCLKHGEGFPVLLLHGFCENREIWKYLLPKLPENFSYITCDIPGFGQSPLPAEKPALSDVAAKFLKYLQGEGITNFGVIGHSMGGYIALSLAKQSGSACRFLCLFHSTAEADSPEKKVNRTKSADFIRKNGKDPFLKTFLPGLYHQAGNWENEVRNIVFDTPEESIIHYTLAMRDRPSHIDFLSGFAGKSLLIAGEYDTFIPADSIRKQAGLAPDGSFYLMKETGHLGMMENPTKAAAIIGDFLKTI